MMINLTRIVYLVLTLIISTTSYCIEDGDSEIFVEKTHLDELLDRSLDKYRKTYPDITFLILKGGDQFVGDMVTLGIALGFEPKSLDYEHPPELREDLMLASANRILTMLQYTMPSAALFKADEPLGWQENVCVLTINPQVVAKDSIVATESLLGLSHEFVRRIPGDMRISSNDYLNYVIDHEVYHCLQSLYIGPQPMSMKELWGDYWHHHNELGADSYALGMHIKRMGKVTPFIMNVHRIRGTALSTADPNHLTCKAVEKLLEIPAREITDLSEKEIFNLAVDIKNKLTMSYEEYLQFMASVVEAMKVLGVNAELSEEVLGAIGDIEADPGRIQALIDRTRQCLTELGG